MYTALGLTFWATTLLGAQSDSNVYRQEFKVLQKSPFYKTIFEQRSNSFLRETLRGVENAKELGILGRWLFVVTPILQGGVVVTEESMPKLYGYVNQVCSQQKMRTPTIFITKNKTQWPFDINSSSVKILGSKGAILIDQDLLEKTSEKAFEAAIAHEIAHIQSNHDNKDRAVKYIAPFAVSYLLHKIHPPVFVDSGVINFTIFKEVAPFILPRMLIGKQFEKEADKFVYSLNNVDGLIEYCQYLQEKEARAEADYADTGASLRLANISLFPYIPLALKYHFLNAGHKVYNAGKWIGHHTFLSPRQTYESRIKAAQRYLDTQKAIENERA
jgi:Zn-dependent protease with chaperone function